jgi:hypothetical protein
VEILSDPLGRQRLVVLVENPGDAQIVVQFEDGDAEILKRREFDPWPAPKSDADEA